MARWRGLPAGQLDISLSLSLYIYIETKRWAWGWRVTCGTNALKYSVMIGKPHNLRKGTGGVWTSHITYASL